MLLNGRNYTGQIVVQTTLRRPLEGSFVHTHIYWHPAQSTRQSLDSPTCTHPLAQAAMNLANQGAETQTEHAARSGCATSARTISLALSAAASASCLLSPWKYGVLCTGFSRCAARLQLWQNDYKQLDKMKTFFSLFTMPCRVKNSIYI